MNQIIQKSGADDRIKSNVLRRGRVVAIALASSFALLVTGASPALAADVATEVESLEGTWSGSGPAGALVTLRLALSPTPGIVATGSIDATSGLLTAEGPFSIIMAGGQFFATPGTRALVDTSGYWHVERLPGGGLSLVRWTRSPSDDQVVTRMQRVTIGRARQDGARSLKFTQGTPFCWDGTEHRPEACGEPDSATWIVSRLD